MQAGGRRFDPVQLHQVSADRRRGSALLTRAPRLAPSPIVKETITKLRCAGGVGFWLLGPNRLLFNNPEEVKRILPRDNEEGGRRLAWRSVLSSLLEVRLGLIVSTRLFLVGRGELRKHLMTIEH